ncbi:peptide chain release factor N(5)-glutamine methyltransferase [Candidatus Endomicrobiellum devescovinae]|jgi:release factor glutamine methyltransferase|uniref:peptide chain release factor N(5)-glutamine methyltransferase n=1 Tax=Candidatus Endomicrobiellum devescovinae TaxID=3242322 RepID=UPI00282EAD0A|nr:peptide chain release factor N(5)-glutamine methyltransferase [Endomicrobium sp.]
MLDGENVYTLLKTATKFLKSKGLSEPKSDAEVLLSFVLQTKRSQLPLLRSQKPTDKQILQYENYVLKRSNRKPAAYIIGVADFMGFEFKVDKNVLIPRPETEILVEVALKIAKEKNKKPILDLCTGSGCIAISLAKLGIFEDIVASDISVNALSIAKENALINNAFNIKFIESDIFEKIPDCKFDMIVSNPPYVTEYEYANLEPELKFEPKNALTAQDDGLFFYKEIAANTTKYLNSNGYIILELNSNKAEDIRQIFLDNKYTDIEIINDYSGLPRILKALKS